MGDVSIATEVLRKTEGNTVGNIEGARPVDNLVDSHFPFYRAVNHAVNQSRFTSIITVGIAIIIIVVLVNIIVVLTSYHSEYHSSLERLS